MKFLSLLLIFVFYFTSGISKEIEDIFYVGKMESYNQEFTLYFKTRQKAILAKGQYSNYITELANKRITMPNPSNYLILPETISKEPLSLVVNQNDSHWRDIVSWTFKVMVIAEELNINSKNIDSFLDTENGEIMRLLGLVGAYGDMIELDEKWAYNIIKQVGNYDEVFTRNLGPNTIINLKRGLNNLYNRGGLLYAPPFR